MNYTDLLSQEEKKILCEIIGGRNFKEFFKRNEKDFSKIRKGFRAKSLTEQQALSIAIANVEKPSITLWVNITLDSWLEEIQTNIETLENEGMDEDTALATTMLDSYFSNNVDLYLKITGKPYDEESQSILHKKMEYIKCERAKDAEMSERLATMEEENRQLSDQIAAVQQGVNVVREDYEQKIAKIEIENNNLTSMLAKAQEKIAELQAAPTINSYDEAAILAQYDDTDNSILPYPGSDEITSLCEVISDYSDRKWLIRYADLSYNGRFQLFRKSEEFPPYFTNRDKIFYSDGPSKDGFYGIWTWSAIPNMKDPTKDYVSSKFIVDLDAIEIIMPTETSNLDDLIKLLKEGIECQTHSRKIMFTTYPSKGHYVGILCKAKDLVVANGRSTLSEDCIVVPVYEFSGNDIVRLDNDLLFYRNAFAGLPAKLYHLKSSQEIVKNIVLSSISWSTYKARGFSRSEYRSFRDFLDVIPVNDIVSKIEATCHCSTPDAKDLLDEFLNIAWKYVDGKSLEDEIILSAISANVELQERTKSLIRNEWEIENKNLLEKAQGDLNFLESEIRSATVRLTEAQEALSKTKSEEERLVNAIAEKEKLAENVEAAVTERIQAARNNVADFIANMAFVNWQQMQESQVSAVENSDTEKDTSESVITPYHVFSESENINDLETHHSWANVIETAASELGEAGVSESYRNGLAAFLCAAYIEKQPILLVGPNAIDIVQAFSAAVTGHKYGILCCEGTYTNLDIAKIGSKGESIIIVNNLIASGWINRLPEILSQKNLFYIIIHPYAEDIQVEPKSLYNFMLPLFTEFFVNNKASGRYYGGYFADDFKTYIRPKGKRQDIRILSKLGLTPLVRNRINNLVATMHDIYPTTTTDEEFLFAVLPIAYASLEIDDLSDAISDPQKGINISANLKRDLQYIIGEV